MDNNQFNGQQPYGQPQADPNMQPQYSQPQYSQPQYGQMDPNMQAFGQPQVDSNMQPQYGQPQYGQQPAPSQPKSNKGLIIGIIVAVAVIAIGALFFILKRNNKESYEERECESCYEVKKCKEYTVSYLGDSEDVWLCDTCYKDYKSLIEAFGGSIK